ncbi:MAG: hypothetical protein A3B70_01705 [Deltaproteobacteria bacterium RIFCSPHIGHO2_02_FULL_40_11]|nr:MAG: hypothetical protein A3B70_01705 [Deltaproteobacteria bacterium RIFCSPHIGHO2_02_FULL_40_11]
MKSIEREQSDQKLFDQIAHTYAKKDICPSTALIRKYQIEFALKNFLPKNHLIQYFLECACGIGATAKYLEGRFQNYLGIDYSKQMIEAAKHFHGNHPNIQFLNRNIKDTGLPPQSQDLIFTFGSMHHMTDLDTVMKELVRIGKPGGHLVIVEGQSANPLIQMTRYLRGKMDPSYSQDQKFFKKEELIDLFRRHGLKNVQATYQGFLSPPFAQVMLPFEKIAYSWCKMVLTLDKFLDLYLPSPFRFLSWNLIVSGQF